MSSIEFYQSDNGYNILDPTTYTKKISFYLESERNLLKEIIKDYKAVIEVGCGNGSYLELVSDLGKKYIGIDITEKRIIEAEAKANALKLKPEQFKFFCTGTNELKLVILDAKLSDVPINETLIFFPFNVFGNIPNIESFIDLLGELKTPIYISSFKTNEASITERGLYYKNCGCRDLRLLRESFGVRYFSEDGLDSRAYHATWILNEFSKFKADVIKVDLSPIGVAYRAFHK